MAESGEGEPVDISAVIVTLGDDPDLIDCLRSLDGDTDLCTEVVLVQNGTEDAGPELPVAPRVRLRRPENTGFTGGTEDGLNRARGRLVLFLNADARLTPGALARAAEALDQDPSIGGIAFRLERPGGAVMDSAGIQLGVLRRGFDRGMGEPAPGLFPDPEDVDAACLAGALMKREALEAARDGAGEILDRRYFAYKEDVDLGWRVRRAGYRIRYLPDAVVIHERGWKKNSHRRIPSDLRAMSLRNRWWTTLKNEEVWRLALGMAFWGCVEAVWVVRLLLTEPRVLKGYGGMIRGIPETLRRRRKPERE